MLTKFIHIPVYLICVYQFIDNTPKILSVAGLVLIAPDGPFALQ